MKSSRGSGAIRLSAAGILLVYGALAQQATAPATPANPVGHSEQAVQQGREIYHRTCTVCHGLNGVAGARGPAVGAGRSYVLRSDKAIFDAVQNGIPGTQMPPSGLQTMDIWRVVAYVRSLRATASDAFVSGDIPHGEQIFREKGRCRSCHMIQGSGGIQGPDLSNVGGERPLQYIQDALTKPRLQIPDGYQPVEVVTTDGRRLSGIAKNDNNFSIQLLDSHERLELFTRDELREVIYKPSIMPRNYDKVLTPAEFQDLLAFLSRQVTHKPQARKGAGEDEP